MSSQWHYTEQGRQLGPISAEELKSRAASGALAPDDLVWKEGMAEWVPACRVKGLVVTPQNAAPSPPPLPSPQVEAKTTGVLDALKTTGRLAAKQAERTRLVTISLTGAYHRLGRSLFETNVGRDAFVPQFSALDALKNQMTAPAVAEPAPQPQGFAQQAKAMAKATADAAQRKVAKTRFDHALITLGKAAYGKRNELDLPQQEAAAIDALIQQTASIDADIQQLSADKPGRSLGRSLIDNRIVHAVLTLGCFPIGLFLIWRSQLWSKRAKLIWTGTVAGLMVLGTYNSVIETRAMNASLAEAKTAWDSGKEVDAVDLYRAVLNDHWYRLNEANLATSLRRVVEYDVNHGNEPAARKLLEKAIRNHVSVAFADASAQRLQSEIEEAAAPMQRSAEDAGEDSTRSGKENRHTAAKTYKVKRGLLKGTLSLELSPSAAEEISLSSVSVSGNYIRFTVEYHVQKRATSYTYIAYDAQGVKVDEDAVANPTGSPGEKAKAYILLDDISKVSRVLVQPGGYGPVRVRVE